MNKYKKLGYLNNTFEIFHIVDKDKKSFNYHYHDFYKVLIFINGNVSYHIEGKCYTLKNHDIVLINPGEIHKPVIHDNEAYERIIIYISKNFFSDYKKKDIDLSLCFNNTMKNKSNLMPSDITNSPNLCYEFNDLLSSINNKKPTDILYQKCILIKIMIIINTLLKSKDDYISPKYTSNKKILELLSYINNNLSSNISIDMLSKNFFINRSYLMHLFKSETGYTILQYITEKRLFKAKNLINEGLSLTDVCYKCGFKNYSTFFKAFKNRFNCSPKNIIL